MSFRASSNQDPLGLMDPLGLGDPMGLGFSEAQNSGCYDLVLVTSSSGPGKRTP